MSRLLLLVFFGAILGSATDSFANQEVELSSPYSSASPYLAVLEDSQNGSSSREPGLYRRENSDWKLIAAGRLLLEGNRGPFIRFMGLSNLDQRDYGIAIIDGRLHIFTNRSDQSDPTSSVVIGSDRDFLTEIGSSQRRHISPITNPRNISIFLPQQSFGGVFEDIQLGLISVKPDDSSSGTPGTTILFGLKAGRDQSALEWAFRPMIVDYDFHEEVALQRMLFRGANSSVRLFSRILIDRMLDMDRSPFARHASILEQWIQSVTRLRPESSSPVDLAASISYDLNTRRLMIDRVPEKVTIGGSLQLRQAYNLLTGVASYFISASGTGYEGSTRTEGPHVQGLAEFRPDSTDFVIATATRSPTVGFFAADGRIYLTLRTQQTYSESISYHEVATMAANRGRVPRFFDAYAKNIPPGHMPGDSGEFELVIASFGYDESTTPATINAEGFTEAYLFRVGPNDSRTLESKVRLLDNYINGNMIVTRIASRNNDATALFFDARTAAHADLAAYAQSVDPSRPSLDLLRSRNSNRVWTFLSPRRTIEMGSSQVKYREYEPALGVEDPTGLVLGEKVDERVQYRIRGQLLPNPDPSLREEILRDPDNSQHYVLGTGVIRMRSGELRMLAHALDATRQNGGTNFKLVIVLHSATGPTFLEWNIDAPISTVDAVRIVTGKAEFSNQVAVFVSLNGDPQVPSQRPQTMVATFTAGSRDQGRWALVDETPLTQIADSILGVEELRDRLVFAADGELFLSQTPTLARTARDYQVMSLTASRNRIRPNLQPEGKRRQFNLEDRLGSDSGLQDQGRISLAEAKEWYVGQKRSQAVTRLTGKDNIQAPSTEETELFQSLVSTLDGLVVSEGPSHRVLIVPPTLMDLAWNFIIARYASNEAPRRLEGGQYGFTNFNERLALHYLESARAASQEEVFGNLDLIRHFNRRGARNVILARGETLVNIGRVAAAAGAESSETFLLRDIAAEAAGGEGARGQAPHILYNIVAGGPLGLEEFRQGQSRSANHASLSVVTPDEWATLQRQAQLEVDYGLLDQIEVTQIADPNPESMEEMLVRAASRGVVTQMQYTFNALAVSQDAAGKSSAEQMRILFRYAVSKTESLARQRNQNVFSQFMQFLSAMTGSLLTDRQARQSRVVDRAFIDRSLALVFDLPLSVDSLPEDDPLRIALRPDTVTRLQELGVSSDFATRLVNMVRAQMQSNPAIPIPSSMLIMGPTGTGKTQAIFRLARLLGLQEYDFSNQDRNLNAGFFYLNVGRLRSSSKENRSENQAPAATGNSDLMEVEMAIDHLKHFLTLPNGHRGLIFIDDGHASSKEVRQTILTQSRALLGSENRMYTVTSPISKGAVVTRPTRNLMYVMAINPTDNPTLIKKFTKEGEAMTAQTLAIASLSTDGLEVEASFLKRFGFFYPQAYSAQSAAMISDLQTAARDLLTQNDRVMVVSPDLVSMISQQFRDVDARTLLGTTRNVLDAEVRHAQRAPIYLLLPNFGRASAGVQQSGVVVGDPNDPTVRITNYIRQNVRVLAVQNGIEGRLELMRVLMATFRVQVFEAFVNAVRDDARFADTPSAQSILQTPAFQAVRDYLITRPSLPLESLILDPSAFGMTTPGDRAGFQEMLREIFGRERPRYPSPYFHYNFGLVGNRFADVDVLLGDTPSNDRMRLDVLREASVRNLAALEEQMRRSLHLRSFTDRPSAMDWLRGLPENLDPNMRVAGAALTSSFFDFFSALYSSDLLDNAPGSTAPPLPSFGAAMMFLNTIDKAITRLPWPEITEQVQRALELVARDQGVSQNIRVQEFFLTSRFSLLRPATVDLARQIAQYSLEQNGVPPTAEVAAAERFRSECERYVLRADQ